MARCTLIECDYQYPDGRRCDKKFHLTDSVETTTPGTEEIVSITIPILKDPLFFCSMIHAVAFGVAWEKARPKTSEAPKKNLTSPQPSAIVRPSKEDIEKLRRAGLIEPEDLNLRED